MLPGRPGIVVLAASLLLAGAAFGQDPFEGALKGFPKGCFAMLHRQEDVEAAYTTWHEDLLRLRLEHQLLPVFLTPQVSEKLWKRRGWGNQPAWILVSDAGEELDAGAGLPPGPRVLAALRSRGLAPRWELRRAFIKEHPENGPAWSEDVFLAARLAYLRMRQLLAQGRAVKVPSALGFSVMDGMTLAEPAPEARERLADQVFGELSEALGRARGVEDWWRDEGIGINAPIGLAGGSDSGRMRGICRELALDLEKLLARGYPFSSLDYHWQALRTVSGEPVRDLPDAVSPPWEIPFSPRLASACIQARAAKGDWDGILGFLDGLGRSVEGTPEPPPWEERCAVLGLIAGWRVRPLWELGRNREALAALEEQRAWSGPSWAREEGEGRVGQEPALRAILKQPALPFPPAPSEPARPNLALLGDPAWRGAWENLRASEALLPWSPAELPWTSLAPAKADALRAAQGWGPEPRWALLLDGVPLASGTTCPPAALLAGILARERPARLQVLAGFLERHPDHLRARLARIALLKARMPEPRLEQILAADIRAAFEPAAGNLAAYPLDFGPDAPWKPALALWQGNAQQVLPRLETLLHSWPNSQAVWKAWLAWARFHPARPSVVALASSLTLWGNRDVWIGQLPADVHLAVTDELRQERNYAELARWLRKAWESHCASRRNMARSDSEFDVSWHQNWQATAGILLTPLQEALRLLGRPEEARQAEAEFRELAAR